MGVGLDLASGGRSATPQMGFVLVRLEHGVTCTAMFDLEPRDITSRGGDRRISSRGFRDEPRSEWSQQNSLHEKIATDRVQ